ncbi:Ohr family peroxiredoxin [Corynebacterium epidermidicanis]|uniref:Peroxiredoxin, Ohr subfamily n=1 Tax=Corynebacterium epidermidicanis TaxID=1050174 RepID=A0A0G3GRI3_9CORY|nr:Ohr family peroxiredoxin [Corynebacterium epidermidicanis]AKK02143.1 peroxiredoxin, Ohr subfamily [Corynebacterium epidermidicanis]
MSEVLYTGSVTSTGGGRDGHVTSTDGHIDFDVRPPKELGGSGEGVNPETLFAAAWSACFNGALHKIMKDAGVDATKFAPEVTAVVSLNKVETGFGISGEIQVAFANQDELEDAAALVEKAHEFCPYSRALRGDCEISARLA